MKSLKIIEHLSLLIHMPKSNQGQFLRISRHKEASQFQWY